MTLYSKALALVLTLDCFCHIFNLSRMKRDWSASRKSQLPMKILVIAVLIGVAMGQCPTGTTGFNCVECPTGCDTCDTSSTTCDACTKGYYISSSTCIACPNNCLQCQTPTYCITCIPGYDATTNADGNEQCEFKWWKWFLIIFGSLFVCFLLGLLGWWVRQKLNEQDNEDKQVDYQMKQQDTQDNIEQK